MGYVESLLREKLDANRKAYQQAIDDHNVPESIALGCIVQELMIVLALINDSEEYQNREKWNMSNS